MNRIVDLKPFCSVILAATVFLLTAAQSCSLDRDVSGISENQIVFSTDLNNMTKASEIKATDITSVEVWGFLEDNDQLYLHDTFTRDGDRFVSKKSYFWPGGRQLYFIAFLPEQIKHFGASVETSTKYLTNVTVNKNISQQQDLISAYVPPTSNTKGAAVNLPFRHALAQIEIRALNSNAAYVIKVKGVKIGKVYDFAERYNTIGVNDCWYAIGIHGSNPGLHPAVNFTTEFTSPITLTGTAQSIMGPDGNAIMMDQKDKRATPWDPETNPTNKGNLPYLAVLVDIDTKDGAHVYPSSGAGFAWTAVGIDATWDMGRKYIYTLDFSQGAGNVDPDGPGIDGETNYGAGDNIFGSGIKFTAQDVGWNDAEEDRPLEQ